MASPRSWRSSAAAIREVCREVVAQMLDYAAHVRTSFNVERMADWLEVAARLRGSTGADTLLEVFGIEDVDGYPTLVGHADKVNIPPRSVWAARVRASALGTASVFSPCDTSLNPEHLRPADCPFDRVGSEPSSSSAGGRHCR